MARSGQFKKGGGRVGAPSSGGSRRKSKRRSSAKGLTIVEKVSSPAPVVKVVHVPTAMAGRAPARRGGGGKGHTVRHHRSEHAIVMKAHGAGEMLPGPFRLRSMALSGLLGYADSGKGMTALKDLIDKLPALGKVPKEALAGAVMNYFADRGDWLDSGAQALLDVGGYKLGQAGFVLSGDDDDNY